MTRLSRLYQGDENLRTEYLVNTGSTGIWTTCQPHRSTHDARVLKYRIDPKKKKKPPEKPQKKQPQKTKNPNKQTPNKQTN